MRVGTNVLVTINLPEGGLEARGLDPPGVLEGNCLVIGRMDDEERYSLLAEYLGVLLRSYSPGVYAQVHHRVNISGLCRAISASVALPTTVCPSSGRTIEVIKTTQ